MVCVAAQIPKHLHPIVIGSLFVRRNDELLLDLRSCERALLAIPFFDKYLPRKVAKVLKHRPAKVKVVAASSDAPRGQSSWRMIAEKVATAVAVSIAGALASRIIKPGGRSDPSRPQ